MAKVIEFYVRDLFPQKVKSLPHDRRSELIEFPKNKAAVASNTPGSHDEGYALVTARNAAAAVERGRKRGRG
jgi:hypothetical protein